MAAAATSSHRSMCGCERSKLIFHLQLPARLLVRSFVSLRKTSSGGVQLRCNRRCGLGCLGYPRAMIEPRGQQQQQQRQRRRRRRLLLLGSSCHLIEPLGSIIARSHTTITTIGLTRLPTDRLEGNQRRKEVWPPASQPVAHSLAQVVQSLSRSVGRLG